MFHFYKKYQTPLMIHYILVYYCLDGTMLMIDGNLPIWCFFMQLPPEWTDQFESGIQVRIETVISLFLVLR